MNARIISFSILLIIFSMSGAYYNNLLVSQDKSTNFRDENSETKESTMSNKKVIKLFDISSFIAPENNKAPINNLINPQPSKTETSDSVETGENRTLLNSFCQQVSAQGLDVSALTPENLVPIYKDKAPQYYDFLILVTEICKDGALDYNETLKIVEKTSDLGIDLTKGF